MTKTTTRKKKTVTGEYRNLKPIEGRPELYEFEVKLKSGEWQRFSGLKADTQADREAFAQNTANDWIKR